MSGANRRARNTSYQNEKVPLKGLFSDGIWKCNCDPRLPAEHFQTKNGGRNHGRWCKLESLSPSALIFEELTGSKSTPAKSPSKNAATSSSGTTKPSHGKPIPSSMGLVRSPPHLVNLHLSSDLHTLRQRPQVSPTLIFRPIFLKPPLPTTSLQMTTTTPSSRKQRKSARWPTKSPCPHRQRHHARP